MMAVGSNSGQSQHLPVVSSGMKMPMIVNIQSIVPKSRTTTMVATPTQQHTSTTRMLANVNNGAGGLMSNVDIKYELKDVKDDLELGS